MTNLPNPDDPTTPPTEQRDNAGSGLDPYDVQMETYAAPDAPASLELDTAGLPVEPSDIVGTAPGEEEEEREGENEDEEKEEQDPDQRVDEEED